METTYTGFYARFDTPSKKDAAVLLGADNLVGDLFDVEFVTEESSMRIQRDGSACFTPAIG